MKARNFNAIFIIVIICLILNYIQIFQLIPQLLGWSRNKFGIKQLAIVNKLNITLLMLSDYEKVLKLSIILAFIKRYLIFDLRTGTKIS